MCSRPAREVFVSVWAFLAVAVVIVDIAAVLAGVAIGVDRALLAERSWRFGLRSLLIAAALAAINLATFAGGRWMR
jgi:hypothetical protein